MNTMAARYRPAIIAICTGIALCMAGLNVWGKDIDTVVVVGNIAPEFDVPPTETTPSTAATPIAVGQQVVFSARASEANNEEYYLAICKTNGATPQTGAPPVCTGGAWCISEATSAGATASCAYLISESDSEVNDWHAFLCDKHPVLASCSSANQGSDASGSPFYVNHPPNFGTLTFTQVLEPGMEQTWTAGAGTEDVDQEGGGDTLQLSICRTNSFANGECAGGDAGTWCTSEFGTGSLSCDVTLPLPSMADSYAAYAYLVDNHGLASEDITQGQNVSFQVRDIPAQVNSTSINAGSDIHLTAGSTTTVVLQTTITDVNSCGDIQSVTASFYRSGIGFSGCNQATEANPRNCYPLITCVTASQALCSAGERSSAQFTCVANVQYLADPTDQTGPYANQHWEATFTITDSTGSQTRVRSSHRVQIAGIIGYQLNTQSVTYGRLRPGQVGAVLGNPLSISVGGNVALDLEVRGESFEHIASKAEVPVNYQRFSLRQNTLFSRGQQLSTSYTELESNCGVPTSVGAAATCTLWWGAQIPADGVAGEYRGVITLVAALSSGT